MKKAILLSAVCLMSAATSVFGQTHTQSISFDDGIGPGNAGTYNSTDSFGVDLYLTYNGYAAYGYDLHLVTTADAAPHLSLTDYMYGPTFPDPLENLTFPLSFTRLLSNGLYGTSPPGNLGSLAPGNRYVTFTRFPKARIS